MYTSLAFSHVKGEVIVIGDADDTYDYGKRQSKIF